MAKKKLSEYHGVLLVDKPAGITSHDVVDRVRRFYSTRRVGHTGTLDPQATGLLVLLLGEATKISEYMVGVDKSYEGTIRFGVVSDTYDKDGEITVVEGKRLPTKLDKLQDLASELTGDLMQVPPPYSAKKVAGKKLYEYAREGEVPKVDPRPIRVDDFEILTLADGLAEFGVDCSSGTYVRSLAHELGQKLGCGAILTELRRTDVGPFRIEDAHTLEALEALDSRSARRNVLIPIRMGVSEMMTAFLAPGAEGWLRRGQPIPHSMVTTEDDLRPSRGSMAVLCRVNGQAVAIARVDSAPMSAPPKAMAGAMAPWYQPLKQFDIPEVDDEDDDMLDTAPEVDGDSEE